MKAIAYVNEANASASLKMAEKNKIDQEVGAAKDSVIGKLPRETQMQLNRGW